MDTRRRTASHAAVPALPAGGAACRSAAVIESGSIVCAGECKLLRRWCFEFQGCSALAVRLCALILSRTVVVVICSVVPAWFAGVVRGGAVHPMHGAWCSDMLASETKLVASLCLIQTVVTVHCALCSFAVNTRRAAS